MASPISPGEGLAEVITNTSTSNQTLIWFVVVSLVVLPILMWLKDMTREWFERVDKREERKEKLADKIEERKEKWEDKKGKRDAKKAEEDAKRAAEKERWEAKMQERREIREHQLKKMEIELQLVQAKKTLCFTEKHSRSRFVKYPPRL